MMASWTPESVAALTSAPRAEAYEQAVSALEVEDADIQNAAIAVLRALPGGIHAELEETLKERPLHGLTAVRALRAVEMAPQVTSLLATSTDGNVRSMAALTLGTLDVDDRLEALVAALNDGVPAVRAQASSALGAVGTAAAVDAVKAAFAKETDNMVKVFLVDVLDAHGAL